MVGPRPGPPAPMAGRRLADIGTHMCMELSQFRHFNVDIVLARVSYRAPSLHKSQQWVVLFFLNKLLGVGSYI